MIDDFDPDEDFDLSFVEEPEQDPTELDLADYGSAINYATAKVGELIEEGDSFQDAGEKWSEVLCWASHAYGRAYMLGENKMRLH